MPPQTSRSSEADYTGSNPYGEIPADKPMTRAHAMNCFNGPEKFTAFTDYWVVAPDDEGDVVSQAHTVVISNHQPGKTYQDDIEKYVSHASQSFDQNFLNSQLPRFAELRTRTGNADDQDAITYLGRVTPDIVFDLITEEHKRKWVNLRAEDQSRDANNARALGAAASIGAQGGPFNPPSGKHKSKYRVIEFCGATPCSFVEPAILQFMTLDGQITIAASSRHYTNTLDSNANRISASLAPRPGPGITTLQAFQMTREAIQRLNDDRTPDSRFWVEVDHRSFEDLQHSNMCNARLHGGKFGIVVRPDNTDGRFTFRDAHISFSGPSSLHIALLS
jgi:hypothetical protein